MTLLVALLTLAAASPAPPDPALDGVEAIEHVPLAPTRGPLRLRVSALDASVVLEAPRDAGAVLRDVRASPRAVCPGVARREGEVRLLCRSRRIVARLVERPRGAVLEVWETRGLPWQGEDAPQLFPFPPPAVGLGAACPGSTAGGRAECALARGEREAALAALHEAAVAPGAAAAHAALRLGDLAFASGDLRGAATRWARAHGTPWERVAAARMCELSASCLTGPGAEALFAGDGLPEPLARDLAVRRARALAFLDRPIDAVRVLAAAGPAGCSEAPALCQRIALLGLREPGATALEALALWVELPARDRGPLAYETELAAAAVAEREGAPGYAASVLAAAAARAPARALQAHLLRTAELYVAADDRIRAGVVLEFARARAGKKGLVGPRWAAVARAVAAKRRPAAPPRPAPDAGALLAAADRAVQAARALGGGTP